ncbi:MAG: hypothetical protein ACHQ53_07530 [Polyangiales bacterium]
MAIGCRRCCSALAALLGLLAARGAALAQAPSSADPPEAGSGTAPSQQASSLRVAVLRTTQGEGGATADAVDAALLRDLAELAGIEKPTVSPIDYAEIQLTVGCSDEGKACLSSIAQMVQVDGVVVRRLTVEQGRMTLTLLHFDATATDEPAHAEETFEGADAGKAAVAAVPSLVRRLFGIPEPVVAAAVPAPASALVATSPGPTSATTDRAGGGVGALSVVTLAAGAGILTGGLVVGASAKSSFDEFKAIKVVTEDDARRANSKFDAVKSKALAANVLMPSGAAVLALGAALLVLDLTRGGPHDTEVSLLSLRGGAMLTLRGTTRAF